MMLNAENTKTAKEISKIFCSENSNKTLCESVVYRRIISYFNDTTFEYFLSNIQSGRFEILEYSNWRSKGGSSCRNMIIDVKKTDVFTGQIKTGYWYYDSADCNEKQYYFPDLNTLISRQGNILLSVPISSKNNSDISKPRLIHNKMAMSYGIIYVPPITGGGGGGSTYVPPGGGGNVSPDPLQLVTPDPGGIDFGSLLENPIVLIGGAVVLFLLLKNKF